MYFSENEQIVCTITRFNLQDIRLSRKKQSTKKFSEKIKLKCKKIHVKTSKEMANMQFRVVIISKGGEKKIEMVGT